MGVITPDFHLTAAHDLPEMRKMLKGGNRKKRIFAELSLTSLIDMFSVIIIFLIQSFSASGEVMIINKDIKLPIANYGKELERAPIITILTNKVTLEGVKVGDNTGIETKLEESDWDLPLLSQKLNEYREFFQSVNPTATFPAEVVVQADRDTQFLLLKRVMYALTKVGYTNINLAVMGQARPATPPEASPVTPPSSSKQ